LIIEQDLAKVQQGERMILTKRINLLYLLAVLVLLASTLLNQPAQVHAQQDWRDLSADVDGDGLPNDIEDDGWYNAAGGPYVTDYLDADSDDDGLTDGQEKLYNTIPLDGHSPGIYVEYQDDLMTKEYFPWQRYGNRYIALPTWEQEAAVVRRGSTFSVGGLASSQISITPSIGSLTPLTAERNPCTGRWDIHVPEDGTVGIYTITVEEGGWSRSLNLYVIFEVPTGLSTTAVNAFLYDDVRGSGRDETSLGYFEKEEGAHYEYDNDDYEWIPEGEWITHGSLWGYDTMHFL
jgi:hypothetical protein